MSAVGECFATQLSWPRKTELTSVESAGDCSALLNNTAACGEPQMDMEMIAAFGYGAKPYQWHNDEAGGLFQGTLNSMMKVPHPPLVICASLQPMKISGKHTHSYFRCISLR